MFAADRVPALMAQFGISQLGEFQLLAALKLQEETGEVADAVLGLRGLQRVEKQAAYGADVSAVATEIADVMVSAAVLAASYGLDVDAIVSDRLGQIEARSQRS